MSTEDEYTPTTGFVRDAYIEGQMDYSMPDHLPEEAHGERFDRWLEGERASARTFAESDPEVEAAARAMYVIDPQLSMAGAKTLAKAALQAATHHTNRRSE